MPDAVAGVERGLRNPISATRPGGEDLDGEVRWPLDRALGDDRFPARGDEDQVGLHDRGRRENDVDGSAVDPSQPAFLAVAVEDPGWGTCSGSTPARARHASTPPLGAH